jgi:hypothetical protein
MTNTAQLSTKGGGGGIPGCSHPNPPKLKFKIQRFVDIMFSEILRDFSFSRNQLLKSAHYFCIRILKNKLIKLKKQEDRTL